MTSETWTRDHVRGLVVRYVKWALIATAVLLLVAGVFVLKTGDLMLLFLMVGSLAPVVVLGFFGVLAYAFVMSQAEG